MKISTNPTSILNPIYRIGLISSISILIAYFGWFFVRSHITVASVVLKEDGILNNAQYTKMQSVAFICNAISKVVAGLVVDLSKRPKYTFLFALMLCIAMVLLNTMLTSYGWMIFFGSATRFLSAFGRVASLTIVALWFPKPLIGRMSGLINVGVNLGELTARLTLGLALAYMPWRSTFFMAAAISAALAFPCLFLTQEKPDLDNSTQFIPLKTSLIAKESSLNTKEKYHKFSSFWNRVIKPLACEPRFYCLLVMAVSTTAIRETFLQFSQSFFKDAVGANAANSGALTAVYNIPAAGSAFIGGYLLDKTRGRNRGFVPLVFLLFSTSFLVSLAFFTQYCCIYPQFTVGTRLILANLIIVACSFSLSAPNSFLDGAFVVELAGPQGSAFASGFVGSFGYFGCAVTSLFYTDLIGSAEGWYYIWIANAFLSGATCIACFVYWTLDRRILKRAETIPVTYSNELPSNCEDLECFSDTSKVRFHRRRSSTAVVDVSDQLEVFIVQDSTL